jgi:uncharacterized protein (DUF58 family)
MLSSAALLAHTADLDVVIRHVLAGLGHGIHAGRERGAGVEFSEYRAYAPGDEWRRVDWKLLARADRYFVREAERDSHVAIWLVLDATASMAEPSRKVEKLDKMWYARTVLACVAAIAQRQGDAFGLLVLQDGKIQLTPASRGPRQMHRVIAALNKAEPRGALPSEETLKASLHFARSPSVIFAVSDFLDWPSPLTEALIRLRHMHHDVRALSLQTASELEGIFQENIAFRDAEHDGPVYRFGPDARSAYLDAYNAHYAEVAAGWRKHDVAAMAAPIEEAPATVLRSWLRRTGRA